MKPIAELTNADEARSYLLQGLCLQRVLPPRALKPALEWALEMVSQGMPLPPTCLVADLGHMAFGLDWESKDARALPPAPGAPSELIRMYEDYVVGKAVADWTFLRAAETLRHYEGRDRARGLAFLVNQFRERAGFGGVELSPGWVKSLLDVPPEQALAQAAEAIQNGGLLPRLERQLKLVITGARRTAEMLAEADVFELEHRTALDEFGQRLALRQVLFTAERFEKALPLHRLKPLAGRQEVPTRVLDEDTYPVGGYTSLSTRGTVESLLHSQLAFMEPAGAERPDLFDLKYIRDELLYYSRDENQFLRRRRTFAFVLYPDLIHARFKDAALPYQRIVLLLALIQVTVRKLIEWLNTDALKFVFYFLTHPTEDTEEPWEPLEDERKLLQTLQREQIRNQTVEVVYQLKDAEGRPRGVKAEDVAAECTLRSRRSLCHALLVSAQARTLEEAEDTVVTRLVVNDAAPALGAADEPLETPDEDSPLEAWQQVLQELIQRWI